MVRCCSSVLGPPEQISTSWGPKVTEVLSQPWGPGAWAQGQAAHSAGCWSPRRPWLVAAAPQCLPPSLHARLSSGVSGSQVPHCPSLRRTPVCGLGPPLNPGRPPHRSSCSYFCKACFQRGQTHRAHVDVSLGGHIGPVQTLQLQQPWMWPAVGLHPWVLSPSPTEPKLFLQRAGSEWPPSTWAQS